jgi:hypothetical protein
MNNVVEKGPTSKQFLITLDEKMQDSEFLSDTDYLLRPTEEYDHNVAYDIIRKELIEKI